MATMALTWSSALKGATKEVRAIFDRWEEVWHHGKLELVSETVGPSYLRHEPQSTRTVTPEEYRDEIAALRKKLPDIHFTVNDVATQGDRAWFRVSVSGTDAQTGKRVTDAGFQMYRIANGRLVETWWAVLSPQFLQSEATWGD